MSSEVAPGTHSVPGATRFGTTTSGSGLSPRGAPATTRPRLQDVAALAGVSAKTASRALTGHEHVSPATLARVRDAAQTLGFRPNQLARELRLGPVATAVGLDTTVVPAGAPLPAPTPARASEPPAPQPVERTPVQTGA